MIPQIVTNALCYISKYDSRLEYAWDFSSELWHILIRGEGETMCKRKVIDYGVPPHIVFPYEDSNPASPTPARGRGTVCPGCDFFTQAIINVHESHHKGQRWVTKWQRLSYLFEVCEDWIDTIW